MLPTRLLCLLQLTHPARNKNSHGGRRNSELGVVAFEVALLSANPVNAFHRSKFGQVMRALIFSVESPNLKEG